jgi:hypothetical protein
VIFTHTGSWIPDPTTTTKEEEGKTCYPTSFVATNFKELKIIFQTGTEKKAR